MIDLCPTKCNLCSGAVAYISNVMIYGGIMAELRKEWENALYGFKTEEEVIEFIFERLDTSDFEDSFTNAGNGWAEPNTLMKYSADEKREVLYEFMMDLVRRANKET